MNHAIFNKMYEKYQLLPIAQEFKALMEQLLRIVKKKDSALSLKTKIEYTN